MKYRLFVFLIVLAGCARQSPLAPEIVSATVKQLVENPGNYSGKKVEVSGYWITGFEWSYLCGDPEDRGPEIWVERWVTSDTPPAEVKALAAAKQKIAAAYKAAKVKSPIASTCVWIKMRGQFEHRDSIKPRDGESFESGFGHLGHWKSRFAIDEVLEVKAVPEPKWQR